MANLTRPKISVTFTELGVSAVTRGTKGVVAIIVRDAAEQVPVALTQATQVPTTLGKDNQDYISRAFLGYVNPPKKVLVYVAPVEGDADLTEALEYMATQDFDYIVGPAGCTADEAEAIATWVKTQRAVTGAKYKAVLPNTAADDYAVINFATGGLQAGKTVYTDAQYCSRIAGLLAGTPMSISATYAPLTELSDVVRMTKEEQDEAITAGKLIAIWDGRKVKLSRAVNSMTTTKPGIQDSFKKIKIVEIMDLIRTDITATAEDEYIGKYANTYDNKLLLITAIRAYMMGLAIDQLVGGDFTVDIDLDAQAAWLAANDTDTSEMSDQEIKEADTGTQVFIRITCTILDAVEDITIAVSI